MINSVLTKIIFLMIVVNSISCTSKKSDPVFKDPKNVLKIPLRDNVKSGDPVNCYDTVCGEVVEQVYEGLYEYDYFSDDASKLNPALADGFPVISDAGKTWTIKIKKGVKFQDDPCFKQSLGKGREVLASDFIYGWKRHANPANESQGFWIFDGKILGINEFQGKFGAGKNADDIMNQSVEGFQAFDSHTIQIKLKKPFPQLKFMMAMHFFAPVPKEAIDFYGKDIVSHLVGTGPFKVSSWEPHSKIVLIKNENFRSEFYPEVKELANKYKNLSRLSGKKLPLVEGIEFNVVKEEQPRWLGFLSGKYDVIQIPKDNFSTAVDENTKQLKPEYTSKGILLSTEPAFSFFYINLNQKDSVLGKNKYLRQAIASAVDQKSWLRIFKNNRGSVQTELATPALSDRCGQPYRWPFDIAKAKKLMEQAGYPEGRGLPTFKFDTRGTDQTYRQIAEFFSKNLALIGVKTEISLNTFPAYIDKSLKGNLQISYGGWVLDYPDLENGLQLLYGPNKAPGPNEANFENAAFDKLYEKIALMNPGKERQKLVCEIEKIIQEEVPWAYGFYEDEFRLTQGWLKSYHTAEIVINKHKYLAIER